MPKNTGKGGKQRKRGKNANEQSKREIVTATEGEAYAAVIAPMGNYQMSIRLDDMTTAIGIVRGALRKKVWIVSGDLIRVQLRTGFEEGTVDIVGKYTHNEAQDLVKQGVVPQALLAGAGGAQGGAGGAGGKSMYQNITFVNQQATVAESAKDKQAQADKSRNKNIDLVAIMKNPNRAGQGIGDSDDENGPEDDGPLRNFRPNRRQGAEEDSDEDSDEDEEDEEGEEGEEDEEEGEEEEEEEETGANADSYYDANRADNQTDWNKHHNHKKDQDYKQRNKRAKENQVGKGGVTAEDVSDI